ncbi:MAG TPA: hypothetical protein PLA94_19165 [Myxococcota bacterium]|nr:hypothetical protein [Myxococcota bacterium]HND32136.1 hypothetical protein [Myxococcota bacterium]
MSSQLELLAALEEIRDLLAPVVQERQRERLYPIPALIEAHRTAHCACESVYAEQEDEARAFDKAVNP